MSVLSPPRGVPAAAAPASPGSPGPLTAVLADLRRVLDAALAVDPSAADEDELRRAMVALPELQARWAALDAAVTARFAASGAWAADGARSVRSWLRATTRSGGGEVAARTRLAHLVRRHPHLAERLARGEVTPDHLRVLGDAHAHVPALSEALTAAEPAIAAYAAGHPPGELRRFLAALLERLDPDAVDAAEGERLQHRAGVDVARMLDGWVHVVATLPPDLGATFLACLRSAGTAVAGEPGAGEPGAPATGGTEADVSSSDADDGLVCDLRPVRTRRLAALARLLAAAEAGLGEDRLPDLRGSRPVVHLTVPADLWLRLRRGSAPDAPPGDLACDSALLGGPGGGPSVRAPRAVVERLGCDATFRRVVVDPGGAVLDVGRATRVVSAALRVAVGCRDRRCRWPGCGDPIDEVHHVVPWSRGGPTDRANLVGLCWWHHRTVHERGWVIVGDADRRLDFLPPAGSARRLQEPHPPPAGLAS